MALTKIVTRVVLLQTFSLRFRRILLFATTLANATSFLRLLFATTAFPSINKPTMSANVKRTASTRISTRLTSHVSAFSPQVTLYEPADVEDSPRRSKRVKKKVKLENLLDLEDENHVSEDSDTSSPKPIKRRKTTATVEVKQRASSSISPVKHNVKSPKKAKVIPQVLSSPHPAPPNWRETYDAIKEMRARFVAPVDTMGCQMAQIEETDPKNKRYSTLVALMLSSQTKDEVMHAAIVKLRKALGGSISLEGMIAADDAVISSAINKVGFHNKKLIYLKQAAIKLRDEFDSEVPKTVDELCSLPGVGPKMAFLVLQVAWNISDGIGVDVHVHRITNLLGWHKPPTKQPEQTRLNLQSWLPQELYGDINHMMVGFGQVVCLPVGPRCDACDLSTKGLCPSARSVNVKNRKTIVYTTEGNEANPDIEIALEEVEEKKYTAPA